MLIIGCDLHSRYQVIAMLDTATGEIITCRLEHEGGEAERFHRGLEKPALIGIEATGYTQWFERMVEERVVQTCFSRSAALRRALHAMTTAGKLSPCHACLGRFFTTATSSSL